MKDNAKKKPFQTTMVLMVLLCIALVLVETKERRFFRTTKNLQIEKASAHGSGTYKLADPAGPKGDGHWSQFGQDQWIDDFLKQKKGGHFVELGGFDGESHSNTLFLEKTRGWSGVLIEASPFTYSQEIAKDRNCWMVNACVSTTMQEMEFKIAGGITTAVDLASEKHIARIKRDTATYKNQANWKGAGETAKVHCFPIDEILAETLKTKHIDYFSLDVEGAEVHVLESIDFSSLTIDIFTIEMQENAERIKAIMASKGYKEVSTMNVDSVFVRENILPDKT